MTAGRREPTLTVIGLGAGGGLAFFAASRPWHTVRAIRTPPLPPVVADIAGRTVAPAVTGLAVVALAGIVAVLATRGRARQLVGAVLACTGLGLLWLAASGAGAPSAERARELLFAERTGVAFDAGQVVQVDGHPVWALVAGLGGVLVTATGAVVAVRGGRWAALSTRYDAPTRSGRTVSDPADASGSGRPAGAAPTGTTAGPPPVDAAAELALWQSLERGEDPTVTRAATHPWTDPGGADDRVGPIRPVGD